MPEASNISSKIRAEGEFLKRLSEVFLEAEKTEASTETMTTIFNIYKVLLNL